MEDLLLTREKLDEIENNPIFTLWLFGNIDESKLTEDEKKIIYARQLYVDLSIKDEDIRLFLNKLGCYSIDDILSDNKNIEASIKLLNKRSDLVITKLSIMKKRKEKAKELTLTMENL